jgi:hypothetical protein
MNATTNISLKVPFSEKDQAKSLGARWNAESKHWYVPEGVDATPFEKWLTNAPQQASVQSSEQSTVKPVVKVHAPNTTNHQPLDDDIDAINARLRDAYESRDGEAF